MLKIRAQVNNKNFDMRKGMNKKGDAFDYLPALGIALVLIVLLGAAATGSLGKFLDYLRIAKVTDIQVKINACDSLAAAGSSLSIANDYCTNFDKLSSGETQYVTCKYLETTKRLGSEIVVDCDNQPVEEEKVKFCGTLKSGDIVNGEKCESIKSGVETFLSLGTVVNECNLACKTAVDSQQNPSTSESERKLLLQRACCAKKTYQEGTSDPVVDKLCKDLLGSTCGASCTSVTC